MRNTSVIIHGRFFTIFRRSEPGPKKTDCERDTQNEKEVSKNWERFI